LQTWEAVALNTAIDGAATKPTDPAGRR
jgi:hypothetical protein